MRSTAGILAGLVLVGFITNCGGDDNSSDGPKGGSATEGGDGGTSNKSGSSTGGSSNKSGSSGLGGAGGEITNPTGCTLGDECPANSDCIDDVCKLEDGETCDSANDCINNCIDDSCTSLLPDGQACTLDEECAHTCIADECAPVSGVGGPCDVGLGAGGAGGGAGAAGAGGAGGEEQPTDCEARLQCDGGTCLTPDGGDCADNVDCINTCVANVCAPKGTIDGNCDDVADCAVAALVCDTTLAKCKLDLLQQCTDNGQCESDRCICSNANCTVRTCKSPAASCLCKWSPADSAACTVSAANLNATTQDPNGCDVGTANYCNQGQCVPNTAGDCVRPCTTTPDTNPDPNVSNSMCVAGGAPTGCNAGYHANITAECAMNKLGCGATCTCVLN